MLAHSAFGFRQTQTRRMNSRNSNNIIIITYHMSLLLVITYHLLYTHYSRFHTTYLYNDVNVLPVKELFSKASILYIIKNNLTSKTGHKYNTRQISNIKLCTKK